MANTPQENENVILAWDAITKRYGKWIKETPSIKNLKKALRQGKKGAVDQWVKFQDNAPFMRNYNIFGELQGKPTPVFKTCVACGFTSPRATKLDEFEIFINRDHGTLGTIVHELLHFVTHPNFNLIIPDLANEAVTEYFTRKVLETSKKSELKTVDRSGNYADAHKSLLAKRVDLKKDDLHKNDFMKKAYFKGDGPCLALVKRGLAEIT